MTDATALGNAFDAGKDTEFSAGAKAGIVEAADGPPAPSIGKRPVKLSYEERLIQQVMTDQERRQLEAFIKSQPEPGGHPGSPGVSPRDTAFKELVPEDRTAVKVEFGRLLDESSDEAWEENPLKAFQAKIALLSSEPGSIRDLLNYPLPESKEAALANGFREMEEDDFHQDNKGKPETKWVHTDGREVVYNGDTGKIETGQYRGTFNYRPMGADGSGLWPHFREDVFPFGFEYPEHTFDVIHKALKKSVDDRFGDLTEASP